MLSKNKIKYIHSLELKKNRIVERAFVAEGNKLVADMLPFFACKLLVAKPCWMATQGDISAEELLVAEEEEESTGCIGRFCYARLANRNGFTTAGFGISS